MVFFILIRRFTVAFLDPPAYNQKHKGGKKFMASDTLGKVTHYFDKLGVAVVKLNPGATVQKGDHVHFKGHATDFDQVVGSLEVEHQSVEQVKAGDDFGLKVEQKVREGDQVYSEKE